MKIQNWQVFTCRIMPEERGVLKIISISACLRHSQGMLTSRTPPLWRCYRCLMSPLFDGICIQIRVPSTTLAKIMEVFTFPASACNNKKREVWVALEKLVLSKSSSMEWWMRSEVSKFSFCACLSRIYNLHVQVSIVICQLKSYVLLCWQVWTFYWCNLL
jgi:hypothetical protein